MRQRLYAGLLLGCEHCLNRYQSSHVTICKKSNDCNFQNVKLLLYRKTKEYLLTDSYPFLDLASLIAPLHFLHRAESLLIDWCCPPTAFSATWLTKGYRFHGFIRKAVKLLCWKRNYITISGRSTRKTLIHLHPKHCWPPSPDRYWSGLSSRSLCLTGNQSACAWGLKTCHPSSCPYLDLQTDTRA